MSRGWISSWFVTRLFYMDMAHASFLQISSYIYKFGYGNFVDMLVELSRREEEENIKADPDIEIYMKVSLSNISKELR